MSSGVSCRTKLPCKGKKILIQAGAGGVGSFAIQYCKNVFPGPVDALGFDLFVANLGHDSNCSFLNVALRVQVPSANGM